MSIPVYFKNMSKRENSNDRFSITGMTAVNVLFKAGTSITRPSLEIQVDNTTDVVTYSQFNEVYIPSFDRYYFIRDWQNRGRKMICSCEVDVLASFWNDYKDQTFYIERCSQAVNQNLPDSNYPTAGGYGGYAATYQNPLSVISNTAYGCYVVGIINDNGGVGGIDYYAMGYMSFIRFLSQIFTITNFGTFSDITDDVAKVIINPFQYIASCLWFPFEVSALNTAGFLDTGQTTVKMGYWNLSLGSGFNVYPFDSVVLNTQYSIVTSITVHKHPDASTDRTYLNLAPYSKYYLYYYPFGMIDLDPLELYNYSTIYALTSVDMRSGMGILRLCTQYSGTGATSYDTGTPFKVINTQVGVEIGVASLKYYMPTSAPQIVGNIAVGLGQFGGFSGFMDKLAGSAIAGAADIAKFFGADPGAVSDVKEALADTGHMFSSGDIGNIASSAISARNTAECLGMTGAISFMNKQTMCFIHKYLQTVNTNVADIGYPTCITRALSSFTSAGFVLCSNAHPQISRATLYEKQKLTSILNSGFYITGS